MIYTKTQLVKITREEGKKPITASTCSFIIDTKRCWTNSWCLPKQGTGARSTYMAIHVCPVTLS